MILAGGSGERLGGRQPKAFVPVAGKPMLAWSLLAFAAHPRISDILVVVPESSREDFALLVLAPIKSELGGLGTCIHEAIAGGPRRQDSARFGLAKIMSLTDPILAETIPVLTHDAARPVVRPEVIDALLARLDQAASKNETVAVIPALPVADTLKQIEPATASSATKAAESDAATGAAITVFGAAEKTVSRDGLYQIQTPQAFHLTPILKAHQSALESEIQVTDDAMLYERLDWQVSMVQGSRLSLKVTYPEDLMLIEGWLRRTENEQAR